MIDTTKRISKVTYNGKNIPLVGGEPAPKTVDEVYNETRPSGWMVMPKASDPSFADANPVTYILFTFPKDVEKGYIYLTATEQAPVIEFGETDENGVFTSRFTDSKTGSNSYSGYIPASWCVKTLSDGSKQIMARYTCTSSSGRTVLSRPNYFTQTYMSELITNNPNFYISSISSTSSVVSGFSDLRYATFLEPLTYSSPAKGWFKDCPSLICVRGLYFTRVTGLEYFFANCTNLQAFELDVSPENTYNSFSIDNMFYGCYSLEYIPDWEMKIVYRAAHLFDRCYSLKRVGKLSFPRNTDCSYMFNQCYSLESAPDMDFYSEYMYITNHMFSECRSLKYVPNYDFRGLTDSQYMFNLCTSLKRIPNFDTSRVTNLENYCYGCSSLEVAPILDLSSCTRASNVFSLCVKLKSIKCINNTGKMTDTSGFCNYCHSLIEVEGFFENLPVCTRRSSFYSCTNLIKITDFDLTNYSSNIDFGNCGAVQHATFKGSPSKAITVGITYFALDHDAIVELFESLPTLDGITCTLNMRTPSNCLGCYGYSSLTDDEKAIATNKGWILQR